MLASLAVCFRDGKISRWKVATKFVFRVYCAPLTECSVWTFTVTGECVKYSACITPMMREIGVNINRCAYGTRIWVILILLVVCLCASRIHCGKCRREAAIGSDEWNRPCVVTDSDALRSRCLYTKLIIGGKLGQLSLASLRGRLIEYQLRLG